MLPLPTLKYTPSPNFSERQPGNVDLVVVHDCEGSYNGSIATFMDAKSKAPVSAHFVLRDDGQEATQMVPLAKKAWHACLFNSRSIGVEMAGFSKVGFAAAELNADANIVAWLLRELNIPCRWAQGGVGPGFCSHYDLGPQGGGHVDPTTDKEIWQDYVARIQAAYSEYIRGPKVPWLSGADPAPAPPTPPDYTPSGTERSDEPPAWPPKTDQFFVRAAAVYKKFLSLGFTRPEAEGLLARAELECALDVTEIGDKGTAFGLFQWHADRVIAIRAGCGIDVMKDADILNHCVAAHWELTHKEMAALAKIEAAPTAMAAGQAVCIYYVRAGATMAAQKTGIAAERWARYFQDNPQVLA